MPHVAEISPIARTLGNILAGEPVRHGALTVIPLLAPMLADAEWLTLAEAGDRVQITEVNEAGSVPTLKVANMADRPLLLLDGEELVGAKQNRILNTTVLVAALGVGCGLALGWIISLILVHVINRQSFHWSLDMHIPWLALAALAAALVAAASVTAAWSGRRAMSNNVVSAVREDW